VESPLKSELLRLLESRIIRNLDVAEAERQGLMEEIESLNLSLPPDQRVQDLDRSPLSQRLRENLSLDQGLDPACLSMTAETKNHKPSVQDLVARVLGLASLRYEIAVPEGTRSAQISVLTKRSLSPEVERWLDALSLSMARLLASPRSTERLLRLLQRTQSLLSLATTHLLQNSWARCLQKKSNELVAGLTLLESRNVLLAPPQNRNAVANAFFKRTFRTPGGSFSRLYTEITTSSTENTVHGVSSFDKEVENINNNNYNKENQKNQKNDSSDSLCRTVGESNTDRDGHEQSEPSESEQDRQEEGTLEEEIEKVRDKVFGPEDWELDQKKNSSTTWEQWLMTIPQLETYILEIWTLCDELGVPHLPVMVDVDMDKYFEMFRELIWEHQTMDYMVEMFTSTWRAMQSGKAQDELKEGSYLHGLLTYVISLQKTEEGALLPLRESIPLVKAFAAECRERFVNSLDQRTNRKHSYLNPCPQKYLSQISTWSKCLPKPFSNKLSLPEWVATFAPESSGAIKRAKASVPLGVSAAQGLHRISNVLPVPSNTAWVKRSGCLERNISEGGTLSMILARIPPILKDRMRRAHPLQIIRDLPQVFKNLWDTCLQELRDSGYSHECSMDCEVERHTPILHMLVKFLGWKNRHLSMNLSALQFLASVPQKYATRALRNMPLTAEAMERSPDWIHSVHLAYRHLIPRGLKGRDINTFKLYIMSGDLERCTDMYVAAVSQELIQRLMKAYPHGLLNDELVEVIRTSLGRYDIFFDSMRISMLRQNPNATKAIEALMDMEDDPSVDRVRQTIGQHMSSSLSFPVMGTMHQAVYDHLVPDVPDEVQKKLAAIKDRKGYQLARRIIQGGYKATYLFGVDDHGYSTTAITNGPNMLTTKLKQAKGNLDLKRNIVFERYRLAVGVACQVFGGIIAHLPFKEGISVNVWVRSYGQCEMSYGLPRKESEVGGIEFKALRLSSHEGQFAGELFYNQSLDAVAAEGVNNLNEYGQYDQKFRFDKINNKMIAPAVIFEVHSWNLTEQRDNTIWTSDSAIRNRTFGRNDPTALRIPDGSYNLRSMLHTRSIEIQAGKVEWLDESYLSDKRSAPQIVDLPMYAWDVGDDHLLVSRYRDYLDEYMITTSNGFNQTYSKKANFISSTGDERSGLVIAERLGRVDRRLRQIVPQLYIKVKQLIAERLKFSESTWMEKSTAIRTQLKADFGDKHGVDKWDLWTLIETGERILLQNNLYSITRYASISIDPRLPRRLGGFSISCDLNVEYSETTIQHLRLVAFYHKYNRDMLPLYVKGLRKRLTRFRIVPKKDWLGREIPSRTRKFYEPGRYRIPRKLFKDVINRLLGFVNMMDEQHEVREVDAMTVASDVASYVSMHYHTWVGGAYNGKVIEFLKEDKTVDPSMRGTLEYLQWLDYTSTESFKEPLPLVDELERIIETDERQLKVDQDTFLLWIYLQETSHDLIEKVSKIRGYRSVDKHGFSLEPGDLMDYEEFRRKQISNLDIHEISRIERYLHLWQDPNRAVRMGRTRAYKVNE